MANTVSFINEQIIYFYMDYRCQNGELFLIPKIIDGKLYDSNTKKYKVKYLKQISGTKFPDYDEVIFEKGNKIRPAEIKFISVGVRCYT